MMSWLDIVDQRLIWPGTAYGRARAPWRRVLGLLDSFIVSLSTIFRLAGSTLSACRAETASSWSKLDLVSTKLHAPHRELSNAVSSVLRLQQQGCINMPH